MKDCKACRKNSAVPCYTEGQTGCWYTQQKEHNTKVVSHDHIRNYDYSNIVYNTNVMTEEERQEKERQGLEKATREPSLRHLNGIQLIKDEHELVRGNGIVTKTHTKIQTYLTTAQDDEGHEDQFVEIQRKITENETLTIAEEYSYNLAMKAARRQATYEIDEENGYIYPRIEERFKASNRSFPTARDGTRFRCPTCNTEELGVIDIKKVAKQLKVSGYTKMKDIQLYSIPEVKTEVLRRMKENDYDGYIDEQNPVSADEFGYCPICGSRIFSNSMHTKGSKRKVKAKERFVPGKSYKTSVLVNEDEEVDLDVKTTIGRCTFITFEEMTKHNFTGYAHKKSDGRGLHEVDIDMKKWRLPVGVVLKENISRTITTKLVTDGLAQKQIVKIKRGQPCECGCNLKLHDERRDEIVCPDCGLVFARGVPEGV